MWRKLLYAFVALTFLLLAAVIAMILIPVETPPEADAPNIATPVPAPTDTIQPMPASMATSQPAPSPTPMPTPTAVPTPTATEVPQAVTSHVKAVVTNEVDGDTIDVLIDG